jgi:peptide deformylase
MIRDIITNTDQLSIASDEILEETSRGAIELVIEHLEETAEYHRETKIGCAGLAANQIGYNWRIITVWVQPNWVPMINPTWTQWDDKKGSSHEGCLSRPGVWTKVKRYKRIKCYWQHLDGSDEFKKFNHFLARVIQHECDHLDGIYINN